MIFKSNYIIIVFTILCFVLSKLFVNLLGILFTFSNYINYYSSQKSLDAKLTTWGNCVFEHHTLSPIQTGSDNSSIPIVSQANLTEVRVVVALTSGSRKLWPPAT